MAETTSLNFNSRILFIYVLKYDINSRDELIDFNDRIYFTVLRLRCYGMVVHIISINDKFEKFGVVQMPEKYHNISNFPLILYKNISIFGVKNCIIMLNELVKSYNNSGFKVVVDAAITPIIEGTRFYYFYSEGAHRVMDKICERSSYLECPICYSAITDATRNTFKCCLNSICSNCFLRVNICPYCKIEASFYKKYIMPPRTRVRLGV